MNDETSPSGAPILRHQEVEREFEPAVGDPETHEAIEGFFEKHVGPVSTVFHEIISDLVHVDVHIIPPAGVRKHFVLFTTGMSDRAMTTPEGADVPRFAELMISLPGDWRLDQASFEDESWYWPVRCLKMLARLPHEYGTWLGHGHSVPNGDPPTPYAPNTRMSGVVLIPSLQLPNEPIQVTTRSGRDVAIYAVHAIHTAELTLKLTKGIDALLDAFDARGVSEVLDPGRPPAVRKKLFGLF